jgi:adenylate cyclase
MLLQRIKKSALPITIGIGIVIFSLAFQFSDNPLLKSLRDRMEWLAYDVRLSGTLDKNPRPHPSIVIIDIDDKSLSEEGRWPWSRTKTATLINKLAEYGVVVQAFDIVFAEPETNIAISLLDILAQNKLSVAENVTDTLATMAENIDGDAFLARSLGDKEVVLGFAFVNNEEKFNTLGIPLNLKNEQPLVNTVIPDFHGYISNLQSLQESAINGGFFNSTPDTDGVIRRSSLITLHEGQLYGSLAFKAVLVYFASEGVTVRTAAIGNINVVDSIIYDNVRIPTNAQGGVLIPFRGGSYSFTYISASDVLQGKADPALLEGKIAFIGTSATGIGDLRPTPVSNIYPGVEVHASIAAGLIDKKFPVEPDWAGGLNFLITLVIGLFLALLLPFQSPLRAIFLFIVVAGGLIGFNAWLWIDRYFVISIASPLVMVFLLALSNLAYGFLFESQGKRQLKDQFGQYVPPQLVDEMMNSGEDLGFEGERREMTVLFADIRSFTTISESLSAQDLARMLNRFFTPMTEIIFTHRGTIDKYVGDMIMAFWGAPLRDPEHAKHAIQGALAMLDKVEETKPEMLAYGYPEINIGVGLNTGQMNVGNMGSDFRRAYTVLGDAVNLGSRLEGLTKQYGVKLIVGETTHAGQTDFLFRRLDKVRVKGKNEPVVIYEPLCSNYRATEDMFEEVAEYEAALDLYYARDWAESRKRFKALKENDPGRMIYSIYLDRMSSVNEMLLTDDWDGVFTHTSK